MISKLFSISVSIVLLFSIFVGESPAEEAAKPAPAQVSLDSMRLAAGLKIGAMIDPGMFAVRADGEYICDGIFSLGPSLQGAFNGDDFFFTAILLGKFRFSVPGLPSKLKFSTSGGLGYFYRNIAGLGFSELTGQAGLGGEYFIMQNISLGVDLTGNITGSRIERFFMNILAGATYYL
jgi:hypothetical protein